MKAWLRSYAIYAVSLWGGLSLLTGCGERALGPVEELRPLLSALSDPTRSPATYAKAFVTALDAKGKAALTERAEAMGGLVKPEDLLMPHGLKAGMRIAKMELGQVSGDKATLRVFLTPIVPQAKSLAEAKPTEEVHLLELEVVREDGMWRLSLQGFEAFLGRVAVQGEQG